MQEPILVADEPVVEQDHHEILGVPKNATQEEIEEAFLKLQLQYNPENSQTHTIEAYRQWNEILLAYENFNPEGAAKYRFYTDGEAAEAAQRREIWEEYGGNIGAYIRGNKEEAAGDIKLRALELEHTLLQQYDKNIAAYTQEKKQDLATLPEEIDISDLEKEIERECEEKMAYIPPRDNKDNSKSQGESHKFMLLSPPTSASQAGGGEKASSLQPETESRLLVNNNKGSRVLGS